MKKQEVKGRIDVVELGRKLMEAKNVNRILIVVWTKDGKKLEYDSNCDEKVQKVFTTFSGTTTEPYTTYFNIL